MYSLFHKDPTIPTYIRGLKSNGLFGLIRIKDIIYQGEKETVRIETDGGKQLTLTPDHELLLNDGRWKAVEQLSMSDVIVVNGSVFRQGVFRRIHRDGYVYLRGSEVKGHPRL